MFGKQGGTFVLERRLPLSRRGIGRSCIGRLGVRRQARDRAAEHRHEPPPLSPGTWHSLRQQGWRSDWLHCGSPLLPSAISMPGDRLRPTNYLTKRGPVESRQKTIRRFSVSWGHWTDRKSGFPKQNERSRSRPPRPRLTKPSA